MSYMSTRRTRDETNSLGGYSCSPRTAHSSFDKSVGKVSVSLIDVRISFRSLEEHGPDDSDVDSDGLLDSDDETTISPTALPVFCVLSCTFDVYIFCRGFSTVCSWSGFGELMD